jgi:WXG100 family type VII secretion target
VTVRYAVDLDEITAHVEQSRAFVGQVQETLAQLDQVVSALHASWAGQAARAHQLAHREWTRAARLMEHDLALMVAAAQRAHDDYHSAASTNHRMWSALG